MSYQSLRDEILLILPPPLQPYCWLSKLGCILSPFLDTPTHHQLVGPAVLPTPSVVSTLRLVKGSPGQISTVGELMVGIH